MLFNSMLYFSTFEDKTIALQHYIKDTFLNWGEVGDFSEIDYLLSNMQLTDEFIDILWCTIIQHPYPLYRCEAAALLMKRGMAAPCRNLSMGLASEIAKRGSFEKLTLKDWAAIVKASMSARPLTSSPGIIQMTRFPGLIAGLNFENINVTSYYRLYCNAAQRAKDGTSLLGDAEAGKRLIRGCAAVYLAYFNGDEDHFDISWAKVFMPTPAYTVLFTEECRISNDPLWTTLISALASAAIYPEIHGIPHPSEPGIFKSEITAKDYHTLLDAEDIPILMSFFKKQTLPTPHIRNAIFAALQSHPSNQSPQAIPDDITRKVLNSRFYID